MGIRLSKNEIAVRIKKGDNDAVLSLTYIYKNDLCPGNADTKEICGPHEKAGICSIRVYAYMAFEAATNATVVS